MHIIDMGVHTIYECAVTAYAAAMLNRDITEHGYTIILLCHICA